MNSKDSKRNDGTDYDDYTDHKIDDKIAPNIKFDTSKL